MLIRALFLWLALALPGLSQTLSQTLPAPLSDTISDYAGLLPPADAARISKLLSDGRAETGAHVVLVVMERIADHGGAGQRIEDYAKALFNQWGVGDPARNDGILILVARSDREMRIALGAGYEVIWDNAAQRVIDRDMLPAFREDRYVAGIEAGVRATFDRIAGPYAAGNPAPAAETSPEGWAVAATMALWALLAAALIFRRRIGDALFGLRRCPSCNHRGQKRKRVIISKPTRSTKGRGETRISCPHCDATSVTAFSIATTSSASGGSSGGFGGGSSSGGGASGRW